MDENLDSLDSGQATDEQGGSSFSIMPSYMVAADNHNVANDDLSGTQIVNGIAGAVAGAVAGQAAIPIPVLGAAAGAYAGWKTGSTNGDWARASAYSAANSFHNTGIAISNSWKSEEDKQDQRATADWIAEKDDNLASYYQDHAQEVDLAGFVVGSMIPGLAGVKAYNLGAKALWSADRLAAVGSNLEAATGLLQPLQNAALIAAKAEITSTNATFRLLQGSTLKALAYGAGEQAIQGAVFETAVAATMFKSPVMDQMDMGDIGTNILHGALFAGALGGVVEGAMSYGAIKQAKNAAEAEMMYLTHIRETSKGTDIADRIVLYKDDQFQTALEAESSMAPLAEKYGARPSRLLEHKNATINNQVRTLTRELSLGDDLIGNHVADLLQTTKNVDEVADKVLGLKSATRMSSVSPAEKELAELRRKIDAGKSTDYAAMDAIKVSYMQMYGEEAGVLTDKVASMGLADRLKSGKLEIGKEMLKAPGVGNFAVSSKAPINIATAPIDQVEARWIHTIISGPLKSDLTIQGHDIPFLSKAAHEFQDGTSAFKIKMADGTTLEPATKAEMQKIFMDAQDAVINEMAGVVATNHELARRANVKLGFLDGEQSTVNPMLDRTAKQEYAKAHAARVGLPESRANDILLSPQHVKMVYDTQKLSDLNGHVLGGIAAIKQNQALYRDAVERTFASVMGEDAKHYMRMPEDITRRANVFDASASAGSFVDSSYGGLGSFFQNVGKLVNRHVTARTNATEGAIKPLLQKLMVDQSALMEASTIFNRMRMPDVYVMNDKGTGLIMRGVKEVAAKRLAAQGDAKKLAAIKDYIKKDTSAAEEILFKSPLVRDVISKHIELNGERVGKLSQLRNVQGLQDMKDPAAFYAPPVDTKTYKHFAFVNDPSITGTGHTSMIYGATEQELDQLISKVPGNYKVVTKSDVEEFKKAEGSYKSDLGLHENTMNADLYRNGVSRNFFPTTDGAKFVDELMQWHFEKDRQLVREAVSTKYNKEFAELQRLGDVQTKLATSKFSPKSLVKNIGDQVANPHYDYIKLALDINQGNNTPFWTTANHYLDQKVSGAYNAIVGSLVKTKSVEELEVVNKAMQEAGIKTAYYDAATDALVNHSAPKGVLTKFIRNTNALLAHSVLGDVFNAVNNIAGMSVLTAPEIRNVLGAIEAGNEEAVGALAGIAKIKIPDTDKVMFSASKLMGKAVANYFDKELLEQARLEGAVSRHSQEVHAINDELTLRGTESVAELNGKMGNAYNKTINLMQWLRAKTGNGFAEEFTRFVAWDSMRQMTAIAEQYGLMDAKIAASYRNTMVNRTQGNYLASQRPLMFSGPVGQAVGLFQTYQFNLAQQLLRHVAEGNGKTAAMMMGLQGTIYGMSGLPAFQAANTYLIGNASGNAQHKDLYSAAYGSLNHDAAEWLMYGAASNALGLFHPDLKWNIYTRGDINPRQATIVPTNFADIPAVSGTAKLFSSLIDTADKLQEGANAGTTILQGIEHAGVNRSLAGIAQTLEAFTNPNYQSFSTTNGGAVSATNDLISLANLGRILGAKPLDEAVAIDYGFRKTAYQMADQSRLAQFGEVMKSQVIGGHPITEDMTHKFLADYVHAGGKQENWNKYMLDIYKKANTSQANDIAKHLNTPYGKSMQELMGGRYLKDFTNQPIVRPGDLEQ